MYIYVCVDMYIYMYIYIEREVLLYREHIMAPDTGTNTGSMFFGLTRNRLVVA